MKKLILAAILSFGIFHFGSVDAKVITKTKDVFGDNEFLGKELNEEILLDDYFKSDNVNEDDQTAANDNKGVLQFKTILRDILKNIRKWLIPIAIIFIVYGGFSIFLTRKDEQNIKKQKDQLISIGLGFMIFAFAFVAVDTVFFGQTGEVLSSNESVAEFAKTGFAEVSGLFDFLLTFAIAAAVAFLILNSFQLIWGSDDDSTISDAKKRVIFTLVGLVILVSVKKVIDIISSDRRLQMPDVGGTIGFIAEWANKILGLVTALAFFAIIWAGIRLIGHFADEGAVETSKNIVISAVIGLILAFSAWGLIYYFSAASVIQ